MVINKRRWRGPCPYVAHFGRAETIFCFYYSLNTLTYKPAREHALRIYSYQGVWGDWRRVKKHSSGRWNKKHNEINPSIYFVCNASAQSFKSDIFKILGLFQLYFLPSKVVIQFITTMAQAPCARHVCTSLIALTLRTQIKPFGRLQSSTGGLSGAVAMPCLGSCSACDCQNSHNFAPKRTSLTECKLYPTHLT